MSDQLQRLELDRNMINQYRRDCQQSSPSRKTQRPRAREHASARPSQQPLHGHRGLGAIARAPVAAPWSRGIGRGLGPRKRRDGGSSTQLLRDSRDNCCTATIPARPVSPGYSNAGRFVPAALRTRATVSAPGSIGSADLPV